MKWFVLSFTLLIQHWAYSQVPLLQVQLGKPATFLCALPKFRFTQREIYWYKQSPGDNLRLIVKLIIKHQKSTISKVGTQLSELRWKTNNNKEMSILTILTIKQEDFGMYHCAIKASNGNPEWSATILIIKGHIAGTLNHNVVQWPTAPDPVNAKDSMIMQCSALSDVENKMCPEDISMLWFTTKSENCHPEINHTNGNRCNQFMRSDSPLNCFHHFFNNVISSDGANVYCTVPLCGAILFGNATKLEAGGSFKARDNTIKQTAERVEEDDANYAALHFSERKERKRGKKIVEMNMEESVYSQIKL
uniref:Ig-like domain-containing protein n=1 Tax=Fundulus heteroclitus TaxID=8078 RepID=A0A3Q2P9V9_FUNHE